MANMSKEQEETMKLHFGKIKNLEKRVGELEVELLQKSREVDEGMAFQGKLVQLVQAKVTAIANKEKQLKELQDNTNMHVVKLKYLEKKVDELQEELREKTDKISKGKELQTNLLKKVESQDLKMVENELLLSDCKEEKEKLSVVVEHLKGNVDRLQEELRKKTEEVEVGKKMHEELRQQINLNGLKVVKNEQQLEEHDSEKKLLQAKLKGLEEKIDKLQVDIRRRSKEMAEGKESYEKLLRQAELKDSELLSVKKRMKDFIGAYKSLKSQYNYICKKHGHITENMPGPTTAEAESDSSKHFLKPSTSTDSEKKILDASAVASDTNKLKNGIILPENLEDEKGIRLSKTSCSHASSGSLSSSKWSEKKSGPLAGTKRSTSYWRDTRSRKCQGGADPHDDFLDTPLENIRENFNKAIKDHDLPGPVPEGANFDSSDDETQDMNVDDNMQKQQIPVPGPGTRGFKYVEPVRKKAERENLKGVECKQCKKFYDAVLPDGGKDADGNKHNARCEHHDGVSRHRYKYVPPMTPEGFWNIGFDSEL
ncbi:protein gamma response 1 isoform X2 [Malania oleifera]|nr:protein gamma response 1 isoform X2 [Malania oleifera]